MRLDIKDDVKSFAIPSITRLAALMFYNKVSMLTFFETFIRHAQPLWRFARGKTADGTYKDYLIAVFEKTWAASASLDASSVVSEQRAFEAFWKSAGPDDIQDLRMLVLEPQCYIDRRVQCHYWCWQNAAAERVAGDAPNAGV